MLWNRSQLDHFHKIPFPKEKTDSKAELVNKDISKKQFNNKVGLYKKANAAARKLREKVLNEKGYPCSEKSAEIEWERMKVAIEKHGVLDGVSYREFEVIEEMAN